MEARKGNSSDDLFLYFHEFVFSFFMCQILKDCCDIRDRRTDARKNIAQMTDDANIRNCGILELLNC